MPARSARDTPASATRMATKRVEFLSNPERLTETRATKMAMWCEAAHRFVARLRAIHVAARAAGGRDVGVAHVIHHHAVGAEAPSERPDGALHPRDPLTRKAIPIAVVIERDHFVR